jgi:hypothetical protein
VERSSIALVIYMSMAYQMQKTRSHEATKSIDRKSTTQKGTVIYVYRGLDGNSYIVESNN